MLRNILLAFSRHVVVVVLGLALSVILARGLGPEGNGLYALAIFLPTMLGTMINFGLPISIVYYVGRGDVSLRYAYKSLWILWGGLVLAGLGVGAAVVAIWGSDLFPGVDPRLLWLSLGTYPLVLFHTLFLSLQQALEDFTSYNTTLLIPPAFTLALSAVAIWFLNTGVLGCVVALGIAYLSSSAFLVVSLRKARREEVEVDNNPKGFFRRAIGFGWKAHLSNVSAFLLYRADLFIINLFLGAAQVGLYSVAVQIAERLWMISQAVTTVLLPRLTREHGSGDDGGNRTAKYGRWVSLITAMAAIGVALAGKWLLFWVFGSAFTAAYSVLVWLLPGVVLGSYARILANDFSARGRPELNLYVSVAVLIVNVVLTVVLVPEFGLEGAAIATSVAYSLNAIVKAVIYQRVSGGKVLESVFVTPREAASVLLAARRRILLPKKTL